MNKLLRTWWVIFRARWRSKLGALDVGRLTMRAWPSDVDILRHINNGVYLTLADFGRYDLLVRSGVWANLTRLRWYPVVANATISYRKSIQVWQKYVLETRLIGVDAVAAYLEQRFTVDGEVYARLILRTRFLKRAGGTVSVAELSEALGVDPSSLTLPDWISGWADDVALPSTKAPAPSEWS